ncbi:MAG: hypothetical protein EXQ95_11615 [Alphaproteobacteria bacterium]|nr:hypothetical protein [Alphaproteobacteria bacterium]
MSFERDLISRRILPRGPSSGPIASPRPPLDTTLLCAATAALVRVDERLQGGSAAVRAGWLARAYLHEASASARLDEAFTDAHDLLLMDHDALDRLVDQDTQRAHQALRMLRAAARRHPRQLFTPRRLIAATRFRLRDRREADGYPDWLEERRADPTEIRQTLAKALDPAALAALRSLPALEGASGFLALWHRSGAADLIGGAAGRTLATAWLRRVGLIGEASFLPAIGFLGHSSDYRPDDPGRWPNLFLEAAHRSAEWQLALLQRLARAERRFREGARAQRATSHLPALVDLILASPAVSPRSAAGALGLSIAAARRLLVQLESRKLIREITGRGAFRLFTEA